jgi:hypothetical protein
MQGRGAGAIWCGWSGLLHPHSVWVRAVTVRPAPVRWLLLLENQGNVAGVGVWLAEVAEVCP